MQDLFVKYDENPYPELPRERSGVVVLRDNKVLLIYRKNERGEYYVVPGGGIEVGETPQQAAVRELQEEAGLTITVGLLLWKRIDEQVNQYQYFFLAETADETEFVIQAIKWQEDEKQKVDDIYRFEWVSLTDIEEIDLKPTELKSVVVRLK